MSRCQCLTANGKQCTRDAKQGSKYCWQHLNCTTTGQQAKTFQKTGKSHPRTPKKTQTSPKISPKTSPKVSPKTSPKTLPKSLLRGLDISLGLMIEAVYFDDYNVFINALGLNPKKIDMKEYPLSTISIAIPADLSGSYEKVDFSSSTGFTNGSLLFKVGKRLEKLPDASNVDHYRKYRFDGLALNDQGDYEVLYTLTD